MLQPHNPTTRNALLPQTRSPQKRSEDAVNNYKQHSVSNKNKTRSLCPRIHVKRTPSDIGGWTRQLCSPCYLDHSPRHNTVVGRKQVYRFQHREPNRKKNRTLHTLTTLRSWRIMKRLQMPLNKHV